MKKIKAKDQVIVISGQEKGRLGEVLRIQGEHAIVSGVNVHKKAIKNTPQQRQDDSVKDGFKLVNLPIHLSNIALYNAKISKADKVKIIVANNQKQRVYKKNSEVIVTK